jgi:hypothetical protein
MTRNWVFVYSVKRIVLVFCYGGHDFIGKPIRKTLTWLWRDNELGTLNILGLSHWAWHNG